MWHDVLSTRLADEAAQTWAGCTLLLKFGQATNGGAMAKVLVGYVNTAQGRAALEAGVKEARLRDAELVVAQHAGFAPDEQSGKKAVEVQEQLETLSKELQGRGISNRVHWSAGPFSAARALLSLAAEEQPDLIVIGIRRRSPVGKVLVGSDSQDILLGANCPVLAVKAD